MNTVSETGVILKLISISVNHPEKIFSIVFPSNVIEQYENRLETMSDILALEKEMANLSIPAIGLSRATAHTSKL